MNKIGFRKNLYQNTFNIDYPAINKINAKRIANLIQIKIEESIKEQTNTFDDIDFEDQEQLDEIILIDNSVIECILLMINAYMETLKIKNVISDYKSEYNENVKDIIVNYKLEDWYPIPDGDKYKRIICTISPSLFK